MTFRAPYRFVPLPDAVVHAEGADDVSHDMPAPNGFSGVLTLTIVADTPLTVGDVRKLLTPAERDAMFGRRADERGDPAPETPGPTLVSTFRTPPDETTPDENGEIAVPGSTTRGAMRSVMELATFGALEQIEDGRFSYRRPGAKEYNKLFTGSMYDGKYYIWRFFPKYRAGFLKITDGAWSIFPCEVARVQQSEIASYLAASTENPGHDVRNAIQKLFWDFRCDDDHDRTGCSKHQLFRDYNGDEICEMHVIRSCTKLNWTRHWRLVRELGRYEPYDLFYLVAKFNCRRGYERTRGRLVFTGQAGTKKHMEFFFFPHAIPHRPLAVPDKVREEFELLQRWATDRASDGMTTWNWLQTEDPLSRPGGAPAGLDGIPVFYLAEGGVVTHFGIAAMFPVVAERRIHDAFPAEQLESVKPDFADLIFGEIRKDGEGGQRGLKARVSFGLARPTARQDIKVHLSPNAIYSTPKASFAEAYLKSGGWNDAKVSASGAKRYGAQPFDKKRKLPAELQKKYKVQTVLESVVPAREGAKVRFSLPLRVHNLTPVELGALLWTLLWGGDETKRHMIGAGKPHGQGVARFTLDHVEGEEWAEVVEEAVSRLNLTRLKMDGDAAKTWARKLMAAFEAMMDAKVASGRPDGWLATPTLRALLGLASPELIAPQAREAWRYMTLAEHMEARRDRQRIPPAPCGALKRAPGRTRTSQ